LADTAASDLIMSLVLASVRAFCLYACTPVASGGSDSSGKRLKMNLLSEPRSGAS
jgi:hypothetical protein